MPSSDSDRLSAISRNVWGLTWWSNNSIKTGNRGAVLIVVARTKTENVVRLKREGPTFVNLSGRVRGSERFRIVGNTRNPMRMRGPDRSKRKRLKKG